MGTYENIGNYLSGLDSTWTDDKFREIGEPDGSGFHGKDAGEGKGSVP